MNYYSLVKRILSVFSPSVEQVNEGDVYEWMNNHQHRYPAVNLTVQSVSSDIDFQTLNCEIIYMDRLMDDKSNRLNIQSTGMTLLKKGVIRLQEEFDISGISYNPFTDKNKDLIAGCLVTLNITLPEDFICDEDLPRSVLTITKNGKYDVTGYDIADVNVTALKVQQKQITITENGTYEIKPDDGYLLDKVEVNVNPLEDEEFHLLTHLTDTGITLTSDYKIEFEFVPVKPYNTASPYATFLSNRNFNEHNQDCAQVFYTIPLGKISAGVTSYSGVELIPYTDGLIKMVLVSNSKECYVECYINDVFKVKRDFQSSGYPPIDNTVHLAGAKNKSVEAPFIFYSLKIYNNGVLVFDGKSKIDKSIGVHYLINAVNNKVIDISTYNLDSIATLELPDTQTITVTNEEYEAIAPILSEMREMTDAPKPVVD